jgi:hypothetical protein
MIYVFKLFAIITWIAGVVLANGFWSTLIAFCFPFWGWYLVVERLLKMNGWLSL